jgi:hypothetical protein
MAETQAVIGNDFTPGGRGQLRGKFAPQIHAAQGVVHQHQRRLAASP